MILAVQRPTIPCHCASFIAIQRVNFGDVGEQDFHRHFDEYRLQRFSAIYMAMFITVNWQHTVSLDS